MLISSLLLMIFALLSLARREDPFDTIYFAFPTIFSLIAQDPVSYLLIE